MMRRIARIACKLFYQLRIFQAALTLERLAGWKRQAVVLLYHHIRADDDATQPLSQVEEGVASSAFEAQIDVFRRWYTPCTAMQGDRTIRGNDRLADDKLLVTFDDGYQDNRSLAGPILRRHAVPAIVFLATGYIDTPNRYWWVRLNDIVRRLGDQDSASITDRLGDWPEVASVVAGELQLDNHSSRREFRKRIATILESKKDEQRNRILDALQEGASAGNGTCLPTLTWHDVSLMTNEGFEIGAHTVNHPRLTRYSSDVVRDEIETSHREILTQVGQAPFAFAYPYGDLDGRVEALVGESGYSVAYAANPGVVVPGRTNPMRVPRIQLNSSDNATLTLLVFLLKFGKYVPRIVRPLLSRYFGEPFEI